MKPYYAPGWKEIIEANGYPDFKSIWHLSAEWFETPNVRRGGWSGVNKIPFTKPDGTQFNVFLKRQQNHYCSHWTRPLKGMMSYEREFHNLMRFLKAGVPTLVPVYFALETIENHQCAILITEELVNYKSLDQWIDQWIETQWPSVAQRKRLFNAIGKAVRTMHRRGIKHNCLYPKHILIRMDDNLENIDLKIIDLEKARFMPLRFSHIVRDLSTMNRRCHPKWKLTDQLRFFTEYLGVSQSNKKARAILKKYIRKETARNIKRARSKAKTLET